MNAMRPVPGWLLLPLWVSIAQGKKVDMHGECAVIVKEQQWLAEDMYGENTGNWDYKIRVEPWTLFGKVTVVLKGTDMQVNHVYGGTGELGGGSIIVNLAAVPVGGESVFEISGYGSPIDLPTLTCTDLYKVRSRTMFSCSCARTTLVRTCMRPIRSHGRHLGGTL